MDRVHPTPGPGEHLAPRQTPCRESPEWPVPPLPSQRVLLAVPRDVVSCLLPLRGAQNPATQATLVRDTDGSDLGERFEELIEIGFGDFSEHSLRSPHTDRHVSASIG